MGRSLLMMAHDKESVPEWMRCDIYMDFFYIMEHLIMLCLEIIVLIK